MPLQYTISFIDYSVEPSSNTVGQLLSATQLEIDAWVAAVDGISLGAMKQTNAQSITKLTNVPPSNVNAQREEKLRITYQDDVTIDRYTVTIPCLDKTAVNFKENSDEIEIGAGASAATTALITAFENFVASPVGNGVTVLGMKYVGRSS